MHFCGQRPEECRTWERFPGGTLSISNGINSAGTVVGYSDQNNQFGINHAFVWTVTGGMQDLNSLIPAGFGWSLTYANAINDAGQIVGIGTVLGSTHALLLTPAAH